MRIFIRQTGNDTTGDGSFSNPYRTIRKGSEVWATEDILDVGAGTFVETAGVLASNAIGSIEGAGYTQTIVRPQGTSFKWINFTGGTVEMFTVANLTLEQGAADLVLFDVDDVNSEALLYLVRCLVKLQDGYLINYKDSSEDVRFDVLHCVLTSYNQSYGGIAFRSEQPNVITVRNSLFTKLRLVVDDVDGGRAIDSDYNAYYDNERLMRIGSLGQRDILDRALSLAGNPAEFIPDIDSPLRNKGLDLLPTYGDPARNPPSAYSWGFSGTAPEIGLNEIYESSPVAYVRTTNTHLLLSTVVIPFVEISQDLTLTQTNRSIDDADAAALQVRFADPLKVFRLNGWSTEEFRDFLETTIGLSLEAAPAISSLNRAVTEIYGILPIRWDYDKVRRFAAASDLKLARVTGLTIRLSAGEVQLERRWYRVKQTDLTLPASDESVIYADGTLEADGTLTVYQSTNLDLLRGFRTSALTGVVALRNGSTEVVGTGTAFTSELEPHRLLAVPGSLKRYVVDSVESDTELTLRTVFDEDDYNGTVNRVRPLAVFGRATTSGSGFTDIVTPGLVGLTTYADSEGGRGHSFHLVLNTSGSMVPNDNDQVNLLLDTLHGLQPVHKLAAVSFLSEYPLGKVASQRPSSTQSSVSYVDNFEDGDWPLS